MHLFILSDFVSSLVDAVDCELRTEREQLRLSQDSQFDEQAEMELNIR